MSRGIFFKKELLKFIDFVLESAITPNELMVKNRDV